MSESTPPAAEQAKPDAAPAAPARPKPAMLIAVLAIAAVAGVGGGFALAPRFLPAAAHAAADSAAAETEGEGAHEKGEKTKRGRIFRLDNLIVNPAGSEGSRFLMASVAFEVENESAEAALKDHDVQVRDIVVSQLESQTMQMLTQPDARDSIKRQLSRAVGPVVGPKARIKVYLPQFVIQ